MPGCDTGKFLSEALIFASTNPQYDDSLFIELWVQWYTSSVYENCKLRTWSEQVFSCSRGNNGFRYKGQTFHYSGVL